MNANKGSLLAILLCILFYVLYSQYLSQKYPPTERRTTTDASSPVKPPQTADAGKENSAVLREEEQNNYRELPPAQQLFENDEVSYRYDQKVGGFSSIELHGYRESAAPDSPTVNLVTNPLLIQGTVEPTNFNSRGYLQARREGRTLIVWHKQDDWLITHEFGFPDQGYGLDINIKFKNITDRNRELTAAVLFAEKVIYGDEPSSLIPVIPLERTQIVTQIVDETDWHDLQKYCTDTEESLHHRNSQIDIMGLDRHYFLSVLIPMLANANFRAEPFTQSRDSCSIVLLAHRKQGLVSPHEQLSIPMRGYFGPKVLEELTAYDPKLKNTLDLGWSSAISFPLLAIIKWLYNFVGNYGVAIILLTILIKILFYPLTRQSAISMHRMKILQPQMNSIREKYKGDSRNQQQELMKFMVANKVNPMKGCIPILPQIPVFFAFYRVLSTSIELRHAPFFGWVMDLSAKDPYYITPLLLGVCMFAQQKLTPMTGTDKNQQRIMMMMPIIFTVMMLSLPSGMVIYMLTNTVVSVMQQQWLNRKFAKQTDFGAIKK